MKHTKKHDKAKAMYVAKAKVNYFGVSSNQK